MSISEFENMDINEELEFNNGVGDALKQKNLTPLVGKKQPSSYLWEWL